MVSAMENTDPAPDSSSAHEALADIDRAQRAVRDTPWPIWLYPVNAILLGAMALTPLLEDYGVATMLAISALIVALNVMAGHRIGTPWVIPTNRVFLTSITVSVACLGAALIVYDQTDRVAFVVALAGGATVSYLIGSVAHHRSTRR